MRSIDNSGSETYLETFSLCFSFLRGCNHFILPTSRNIKEYILIVPSVQWVKCGVVIMHNNFLKNFLLPGSFVPTLSLVLSERTFASFFSPLYSPSVFKKKKNKK